MNLKKEKLEQPRTYDAGEQIAETSWPKALLRFQFFSFLESVSRSDIFQFLGNLRKKMKKEKKMEKLVSQMELQVQHEIFTFTKEHLLNCSNNPSQKTSALTMFFYANYRQSFLC